MGRIYCWRVEGDSSIANYLHKKDIWAGDEVPVTFYTESKNEKWQLAYYLDLYLDWGNKVRTLFISVYNDRRHAEQEADRRVVAGKSKVDIYEILVPDRDRGRRLEPVEFRKVQKLVAESGLVIPIKARHNSEDELVFLHRAPGKYIECTRVVAAGSG